MDQKRGPAAACVRMNYPAFAVPALVQYARRAERLLEGFAGNVYIYFLKVNGRLR